MGIFHKPLVAAMTVALVVVCFLAVLGHALPVDRRGGSDMPNHPNMNPDQMRRPRMPDTPGLDLEEYNRYWKEVAKDNPGMPWGQHSEHLAYFIRVYVYIVPHCTYTCSLFLFLYSTAETPSAIEA